MAEVLKIINFPVQISSIHALAWSSNYKLAISTRRGVYIFSLNPDPYFAEPELNFIKSFIPNLTKSIQADDLLSQSSIGELSVELKNIILQDRVLAPFTQSTENFSHMRYVGFTPCVKIHKSQDFFLVTLSVDYSFRLYESGAGSSWRCVLDLSETLLSYISSHPKLLRTHCSERAEREDYEKLFRKAYLYATLSVSWLHQNRFVSGQEGGQVVFWSLQAGKVNVERIIQPRIGAVTALCSSLSTDGRDITYIGSVDGRVVAVVGSNSQTIPVWDELDQLKITQIQEYGVSEDSGARRIVLSKSNFVLVLTLQFNEAFQSLQVVDRAVLNAGISNVVGVEPLKDLSLSQDIEPIRQPSDLPKADSTNENLDPGNSTNKNLDPRNSTNKNLDPGNSTNRNLELVPYPEQFILLAQKGGISVWDGGRETKASEVKLGVDRKDYAAWSLSSSPNKAIYCLLECVSSFNDHLLLREPARIIFFTFSSHILRTNICQKVFLPDMMEVYRTLIISKGFSGMETAEDSTCGWWLACLFARTRKTKPNQDQLVRVETALRCEAAVTVLRSAKADTRSKFHAAKFIATFSCDLSLKSEAKTLLKKLNASSWHCIICNSSAKKEQLRTVTCQNNHRWGRCGLTQEPCDDPSYLQCIWCAALYKDQDWAQNISCIFCSGPIR